MKQSGFQRFRRLIQYAWPHRKLVAIQFLCMGFSIAMGLLKPWPMKVLVDNIAGGQPFAVGGWQPSWTVGLLLTLTCLAYLLLHAGESVIQFCSSSVAALTSSRMIRDLRADLLRHLQALSLKFHDSHRVGDLVHRVTYNTSSVETAFQSGFMGTIKSGFTLVGIFIIMVNMNFMLTMVALAIVPILLICIRLYARQLHRVSLQHQNQEGSVSSRLQEVLGSIRLVQAFNREPAEQARFEDLTGLSVKTRMKMTYVQGTFGIAIASTLALGTALLFWIGIQHVQSGRLSLGEFLVFNAYLAMLYSPLSVLSYTASSVQSALGGGDRLFTILESEETVADKPGARQLQGSAARDDRPVIEFDHVEFGYEPGHPVLKDVSIEVRRGQMVSIVGETGSGKSTMISLLMRFYEPISGCIRFEQQDVSGIRIADLREQIGIVPQDTILFSDSIWENIAYGRPDATTEEIYEAARRAQAHGFIQELPEGYDTKVGERGIKLSVGQRQRIALARALLKNAPVMVFDEPTSALDVETEARLMETLLGEAEHKTILMVTHRLSTVSRSDRIVVLQDGRIVEHGDHNALLAKQGAYHRMWHAQHNIQPVAKGA